MNSQLDLLASPDAPAPAAAPAGTHYPTHEGPTAALAGLEMHWLHMGKNTAAQFFKVVDVEQAMRKAQPAELTELSDLVAQRDLLAEIMRQRDLLAEAIREAVVKAGIARADADLTGPHLLMMVNDLAEAARSVALPSFPELTEAQQDDIKEAVATELGDAMDCSKAWSAWSHGTMSDEDFTEVREDSSRLHDIAMAGVNAYVKTLNKDRT